ncbi:MAG: hypothetical protein BKP49_06010 [Treponema sp. CETP13]|nr:MAG: hypothetical protein BKP49_06010 [Treponema sp. CETP13]
MINKIEKQAGLATFLLWLVIITVVGIAVLKEQNKTKYNSISIRLEVPSIPEQKKLETTPVLKENTSSNTQSIPIEKSAPAAAPANTQAPKQIETVPAKTQPKTKAVPSQTKATEKAPVPQKLQKSMEELIAEQNAASNKKSVDEVDWDSLFEDSSVVATSSNSNEPSSTSTVIDDSEALSGSVAAVSKDSSAKASSNKRTNEDVSISTSSVLNTISSAKFSDSGTGSGVTSTVSVETNSGSSGGTSIKMSDGSMRKLLDPLKPVLTISPENEKLIDSSITVSIQFTVKADGNVLPTTIKFTPSGLLPLAVQSDLGLQIAKWRFEKGSGDGQAEFNYSINKK